jgi:tetratricopeptide (TPR) repeat protein
MKLESAHQGTWSLLAATVVALSGLLGTPAWAAAPPPVLTPEQMTKMLEEGEGVLKGGNPELAISKYFEPVNQQFMRESAKAGANDEVYASHGATETTAYTSKIAKKNEGAATPTKLVIVDGAWTDSLILKARAQVQMQKIAQARQTLDMASIISPAYPGVWLETAAVDVAAKDWDKAIEGYKRAENFAGAVEDKDKQKQIMCSAVNGQGSVLTEQKKLDEAAAEYKRCLKFIKDDATATQGLQHVAELGGPPVPAPPAPSPPPKEAPPKSR